MTHTFISYTRKNTKQQALALYNALWAKRERESFFGKCFIYFSVIKHIFLGFVWVILMMRKKTVCMCTGDWDWSTRWLVLVLCGFHVFVHLYSFVYCFQDVKNIRFKERLCERIFFGVRDSKKMIAFVTVTYGSTYRMWRIFDSEMTYIDKLSKAYEEVRRLLHLWPYQTDSFWTAMEGSSLFLPPHFLFTTN